MSNKDHWKGWAQRYGTSLRATTKASSAKQMEIDCLMRTFKKLRFTNDTAFSVLEVGCGNGYNCLALSSFFSKAQFYGLDFISEMIESARKNQKEDYPESDVVFSVGDVVSIESINGIPNDLDVVFTDRCLINLKTTEEQCRSITSLYNKLRVGGWLVMIENSQSTYMNQNLCREMLGMPQRIPAEFNHFFDDQKITEHLVKIGFSVESIEDFISLHDLILYVLLPYINDGKIDYEHQLVAAAAKLQMSMSAQNESVFGQFGQNRLYLSKKIQ